MKKFIFNNALEIVSCVHEFVQILKIAAIFRL